MVRERRIRPALFAVFLALVLVLPLHPSITTTAAAQCPPAATHVVQLGETLSAIAARYRVSVNALVQANRLANPNRIEVGQRLVIPGCGAAAPAPAPAPAAPAASQVVHVVQPGET